MKLILAASPAILALSQLLALMPVLAAGPVTFELQHTVQVCNHAGHLATWCDSTDLAASAEATGLEQKISQQLDRAMANPTMSRVYAAEFSFSDSVIQKKMCDLGKAGVAVEIFVDAGSSKDISFADAAAIDASGAASATEKACQKDAAHPNLKTIVLGGFTAFPQWRLHHNKTVIVDAGDGTPFNIDFSSGNLSKYGTSLHMDNWVMMTATPQSNISRASLCLFEGLNAAAKSAADTGMYANGGLDWSKDPIVMAAYQDARQACYTANNVIPMNDPEAAIAAEGIAPFFTPNPGKQAFQALQNQIQSVINQQDQAASYIYIAIEHFTSQRIADLLSKAADKGVDVRIIMNAGTATGNSEGAATDKKIYDFFKTAKVKFRFIETNEDTIVDAPGASPGDHVAVAQQMHNKFALLNGKRVFSGAGHYTGSGLDGNFESLYLTQDATLSREYGQYFKQLWDESADAAYLTDHTPLTTPEAYAPSFLQLVQ